jgi:tetratricopeptide (TPR) repeat protein
MRQFRIALLTCVSLLCEAEGSPSLAAQHGNVTVDWKAELAKAKAGVEKNPKSAFWHNQAGVAFNALGDFDNAVKELKLASSLEPSNPINDYALYALYKQRGMQLERRDLLLDALEKDPKNPFGRFEFAFVLEQEKHWADSIREYQAAKLLVASVTGAVYIDREAIRTTSMACGRKWTKR